MPRLFCLLLMLVPAIAGAATDFATLPRAQQLYATLQSNYGFSPTELAWVRRSLGEAKELPQLVQTEQNNKESTTTWETYAPISVNPANIAAGLRFMRAQHRWLARAEADYGVPPQIVIRVGHTPLR